MGASARTGAERVAEPIPLRVTWLWPARPTAEDDAGPSGAPRMQLAHAVQTGIRSGVNAAAAATATVTVGGIY